jgi:hypothetical protein
MLFVTIFYDEFYTAVSSPHGIDSCAPSRSIVLAEALHARLIALLIFHSPACFCVIYSTEYMPTKVSL